MTMTVIALEAVLPVAVMIILFKTVLPAQDLIQKANVVIIVKAQIIM